MTPPKPKGAARPVREQAKPTKAQATKTLGREFDSLVEIDEQRNALNAELSQLQSRRDIQVGRMQVLAEQSDIDLNVFISEQIQKRADQS